MSLNNKVIWSEGMFLRPVHFQQHTRYVEGLIQARAAVGAVHPWGFGTLRLDLQLLNLGKIAISEARGVFQDGTPFSIPDHDDPPPALELPEDTRESEVCLAFPNWRAGMDEVGAREESEVPARYRAYTFTVQDANAGYTSTAEIEIGKLNLRLLLRENGDDYACLGIARVTEVQADRTVVLDDSYLPSAVDCRAVPGLFGYASELLGMLQKRGEVLAGRVVESGSDGTVDVRDVMLLQVLNRCQAILKHLTTHGPLHPESLYRTMVELAGELATFTGHDRSCSEFPPYRHESMRGTFAPVMAELRYSLSMLSDLDAVVAIPLEKHDHGIRVAVVPNRSLLATASFLLIAKAEISTDELRQQLPGHITIGPVKQISNLVANMVAGIAVSPMPVAPGPFLHRDDCVCFGLDKSSELWNELSSPENFAVHVRGDFPGLELEFWAVREMLNPLPIPDP